MDAANDVANLILAAVSASAVAHFAIWGFWHARRAAETI